MTQLAVRSRRLSYGDMRWLAFALALHALLLGLPMHDGKRSSIAETAALAIRLMSIPVTTPAPESREHAPEPTEVMPAHIAEEAFEAESPSEEKELPLRVPESIEIPEISVARLIELRDSVTTNVPLEIERGSQELQLGTAPPYRRPENWQPGLGAEALAPFDNWFNGKTVPTEVEIVDRWLAADGSHNVIVETPAGLRMCGRASAWDPTRPLIEPVMAWSVCGGDFARPFKFKPRQRLNRNVIETVAKDTTQP